MRELSTSAALCLAALLTSTQLSAKTLVYCSEGSPENFYPAVNTTGTSFDASSQIYDRIVDFERGGTTVARTSVEAESSVLQCHQLEPLLFQ